MQRYSFTVVVLLIAIGNLSAAEEREYRPGGDRFASTWTEFYAGDHEPELDDPLIHAGKKMTQAICEAIRHRDMKLRRYAIGALGFIGDSRALPTLEAILADSSEIYYFRGDALHAIYQINRERGKKGARKFGAEHPYISDLARSIEADEKWLLEPTEEWEP